MFLVNIFLSNSDPNIEIPLEKIGGGESLSSCKHTHTPRRQQVLQKQWQRSVMSAIKRANRCECRMVTKRASRCECRTFIKRASRCECRTVTQAHHECQL